MPRVKLVSGLWGSLTPPQPLSGEQIEAKARENAERMIASARVEIDNQKNAAITDLKNRAATLSIDIAEKLVKDKLSDPDKQKALNHALAAEFKSN